MVISDNARRLLESLKLGGADGYTIMKRSGNTAAQLIDAIRQLPPSMLIVKTTPLQFAIPRFLQRAWRCAPRFLFRE